jgi:hypothetical protein
MRNSEDNWIRSGMMNCCWGIIYLTTVLFALLDASVLTWAKEVSEMESSIMCVVDAKDEELGGTYDVIDWGDFFAIFQRSCSFVNEERFRISCAPEFVTMARDITEQIAVRTKYSALEMRCPNGVVQAAAIALSHNMT